MNAILTYRASRNHQISLRARVSRFFKMVGWRCIICEG